MTGDSFSGVFIYQLEFFVPGPGNAPQSVATLVDPASMTSSFHATAQRRRAFVLSMRAAALEAAWLYR
jgi:hypothetical protein